jgi:outer membrane protein OmpA-like peptidoglycan-associated protein
MSEQKKPSQGNSSRTVVIVAVAVLIVVAIAGIVLAGRNAAPPEATVASASVVPATPPSSGSTPQATGSPTDPLPKDVMFAAGSDKLPAGSNEGLARFAEVARSSASSVRLSARFLTGANKQRDQELAKARTGAIRHALEANGLNSGKMQVELIEMPDGSLTTDAGNRIDLTFR